MGEILGWTLFDQSNGSILARLNVQEERAKIADEKVALAAHREQERIRILSGIDATLVAITSGTLSMPARNANAPSIQLTVPIFLMGKTEITRAQWWAVMGDSTSFPSECADCPVEVTWEDTQDFLSALNRTSGKEYRLPREPEWEYSARNETSFGLLNMRGLVQEWVQGCSLATEVASEWKKPYVPEICSRRGHVVRNGPWLTYPNYPGRERSIAHGSKAGFRIVR